MGSLESARLDQEKKKIQRHKEAHVEGAAQVMSRDVERLIHGIDELIFELMTNYM